MSFRVKKNWETRYLRLSAAGLSLNVITQEPEPTGDYAIYGLKRDVATLLVDNLTETDLSSYVYNTDGMGISVLPEGFSAIGGNCSLRQFALRATDNRICVRRLYVTDDSWTPLNWTHGDIADPPRLAGGAFVHNSGTDYLEISMVYLNGVDTYGISTVTLNASDFGGSRPTVRALSGGGFDDYSPICVIGNASGEYRLAVLEYKGEESAHTYDYRDLVTEQLNGNEEFYPQVPTKTDYVACSGACCYRDDTYDPDPYTGGDTSGLRRCFGAAISASGGVDVLSLSNYTKNLFYSLDSSTVFKYVSGVYIAPQGTHDYLQGSIYVATDNVVKYIRPGDGYMHFESETSATDMYTVTVSGLPSNGTVVKLVGGTGTTNPSVSEGDTDNIVIIKKGA